MGARSKGAAFWKKQLEAAAASGLSPNAYCKKHGLSPAVFYKWRRQLEMRGKRPDDKAAQLIPVEVVETPRRGAEAAFRLVLPALGAVEIRGDFGAVAKVVQLVRWEAV